MNTEVIIVVRTVRGTQSVIAAPIYTHSQSVPVKLQIEHAFANSVMRNDVVEVLSVIVRMEESLPRYDVWAVSQLNLGVK